MTFGIAHKLGLCAFAFAAPAAFALWLLLAAQATAIDVAAQEVAGVRYLRELGPVQAGAAEAALQGTPAPISTVATLIGAELMYGPTLDTGGQAAGASNAFRAADTAAGLAAARTALRDLVTRIGDRSTLILDSVPDSHYLADAVLTRLPDLLDRVADMAVPARQPSTEAAQAQFPVGVDRLAATLDGLATALAAAEAANAEGSLKLALDRDGTVMGQDVGRFLAALTAGGAAPDAGALIQSVAQFQAAAAGELERLLTTRVAVLKAARQRGILLTALLFLVTAGLVLAVATRGAAQWPGARRRGIIGAAWHPMDEGDPVS